MKSFIERLHDWQVERAERILGLTKSSPYRSDDELKAVLYDFFKNYDSGGIDMPAISPIISNAPREEKLDGRKEVRPKDVFDELESVPNPINYNPEYVERNVELMERKINLGDHQFYTKQQMEGMIERLKNRKQYTEHREFYEQYKYTTQEKIDNLLLKYKLCMKKSTLFVPTFPDVAVETMEAYTKETKSFTGKRPEYYVIAKEEDFQQKERKLDPILLVQSPFGFYWQILGAWDDEMLLLDEL